MNAGYAVRKLLEARKLSDELRLETVEVQSHRLLTEPVDIWNRVEFYEHYDMEHPTTVRLTLSEFCNQIVHSWVWMMSASDTQPLHFDGVYVSSDHARRSHVYFIDLESLLRVFRSVGLDDIVQLQMRRDSDGQMQIVKASQNPPLA